MQDQDLDNLLRDWANAHLPNDEKRDEVLRSVPACPGNRVFRRPFRRVFIAALSGIAAAAMLLCVLTPPQPTKERITDISAPSGDDGKIRLSLIVLKQLPDSDSAFDFLEDTILVAEKNTLHELKLGEHRLFLWIYPLEKTLFFLDVGVDQAAETGIVAVPDRSQALHLQSNGDRFDVFVSVLPTS